MKYRRLGKTGLNVSVIGLGTWQLGGEWGKAFAQDEVDRMFARAADLGINLVDTAECYGDHLSESLVGSAIRNGAGGRREDWVVATKFGHRFHGHMNRTDERSAAHVRQQLEDSLRAMKTDYVDLYQFHSVRDAEFDDADLRRVLEDAVASGKVRHLGNSVSSNLDPAHQVDGSSAANVGAIQIVYNRLDRRPEEAAFPSCRRQDLGVLARVPLASGLLTGKYKPGRTSFAPGDFRAGQERASIDAKLTEVERIARDEVPPGVSMAEWALAWCLRHDAVTSVIPGCKSVEQVESNARAAALPMVRDDHPQAARFPNV
ncbi:MAG: Aldo/keto reductase [uncultured Phycisphaerae bacterium]|uniref:Aldo/keto reductase n=1 Tax=uncultured Phycisphaerae bacterium TaxID=904963 RepID=A0A6J4NEY1_9BACT|nr:MAG: Aldo/keto reductase [uncultured Phycisphaerae bacterium]